MLKFSKRLTPNDEMQDRAFTGPDGTKCDNSETFLVQFFCSPSPDALISDLTKSQIRCVIFHANQVLLWANLAAHVVRQDKVNN